MTTKVKRLKARLGLHRTSDADLLKRLNTVHDGINGNPAFNNPPVDIKTFKAGIDSFTVLVTEAEDGGKKAIAAKDKQRELMIKQFALLGHYVEAACDDDLATFNTSGFVARSFTRIRPQPLPPASFDWIDRGAASGEVVVKITALPRAASYELRYGLVGNAGSPPATWTILGLPGTQKVTISNLTPGGTYSFQVRALGRLGHTDWSDSTTFICG